MIVRRDNSTNSPPRLSGDLVGVVAALRPPTGRPAYDELLSKDTSLREDHERAHRELRDRLSRIRGEISSIPEIKNQVNLIARADPAKIVQILAIEVSGLLRTHHRAKQAAHKRRRYLDDLAIRKDNLEVVPPLVET